MNPVGPDHEMNKTRPLRRYKPLMVCVAGLACLIAAYTGWWFFVADQLEKNLTAWSAQQQRQGIELTYGGRAQRGFPGVIKMELTSPNLRLVGERGWNWSTDSIIISLAPWNIGRVVFDMNGSHHWQRQWSGPQRQLTGNAGHWEAVLGLEKGLPETLDLSIRELAVRPAPGDDAAQIAQADIQIWHLAGGDPEFKLRLREVDLPKSLGAPLGPRIQHFDAKGRLGGGPVVPGAWPGLLDTWRVQGGVLDFSSIDLDYAPLRVRGDGTLALDEALQPIGAFTVKAEGFFETVDMLTRQGLIPPGVSFATKITLGVLSKQPENGGNSYLDLALTIQDQTLYAGTYRLFRFAPIHW